MIVAFLHVGTDTRLPTKMVEHVRRVMPQHQVLHMTDSETPAIEGVSRRQEIPYDGSRLMTYRLQHLAELAEPAIILDTDVIVQADLSAVFDKDFDVALTKRKGRILYGGRDIVKSMPINSGVMFSRSQQFWVDCYELCKKAPQDIQRWFGDQLAISAVYKGGRYSVLELPCSKFNYTPATQDEDVSAKFAVHYKGPRKEWMLARPIADR